MGFLAIVFIILFVAVGIDFYKQAQKANESLKRIADALEKQNGDKEWSLKHTQKNSW